jgi:hypothetical protein
MCVCVCVYGGEGQLVRECPAQVTPNSSSQTRPLVEEETPQINTYISRREHTFWSRIPTGLEAKMYCAGEGR